MIANRPEAGDEISGTGAAPAKFVLRVVVKERAVGIA